MVVMPKFFLRTLGAEIVIHMSVEKATFGLTDNQGIYFEVSSF